MFAIAFDLTVAEVLRQHPRSVSAAYDETLRVLSQFHFEWKQGSVYVSNSASEWISSVHSANAVVIYILLGLHVIAIAFYYWRKGMNLVGPMISGSMRVPEEGPALAENTAAIQEGWRLWVRAALVLAACAAAVWVVVSRKPAAIGG